MEVIDNTTISPKQTKAGSRPMTFGPGDVGKMFVANFLHEASCRDWIIGQLHPDGPRCPRCSGMIVNKESLRSYRLGCRVRCRWCGKYFTVLTGTFLSGCHLSFSQVILMAILIDAGAADSQISRLMGMSRDGIRRWRLRFKHAAGVSVVSCTAPPALSGQGIQEPRDGEKKGRGCFCGGNS